MKIAHRQMVIAAALLAGAGLMLGGACDTAPPAPLTTPLANRFPVDGVIDFSELPGVQSRTLRFINSAGSQSEKSTEVTWAVMNDDTDLYVAVAWTDNSHSHEYTFSGPVNYDGVQLHIHSDGSSRPIEDKKTVIATDEGAFYIDQHVDSGDQTDTVGDGRAWLTYTQSTKTYQAEFLLPLTSDSSGQDVDITDSSRLNLLFYDDVIFAAGTGSFASLSPDTQNTRNWIALQLTDSGPFDRPAADSLTGLITFTSTHEDERGEIYTFDPQSGLVVRVTDNDFFEENVSLSNDRTRIAFHGAPAKDAYEQFEIYTINVDGTGWQQLTDNHLLDGHPGWSPDDQTIAYSSFRNEGGASIILMTDDGQELTNLTPEGTDDNDADWLPDGRIVIKTNRFSTLPELRIAVMDADGTNIQQLTSLGGVVDHDPMGNESRVVFERLMAPLSYTSDISALFTPWNIIEVSLKDKSERTIVADRWVNWLPVYDPTGEYLVYLKNIGYTEARLVKRDGTDLGRLIPGVTRITYLDWK